ncbi:MAG: Uma2 family endonuclease [Myxococcota bacterium]
MEAVDLDHIVYPSSDGEPMCDNTLQFEWIVTLKENLDVALPDFVGGDILWYPVQGRPDIRRGPDVLVALGRPKGYRGSYMQFREEGVAPHVVMEVLSPKNTVMEMLGKASFYLEHGAREFYVVDPDHQRVQVWIQNGGGHQGTEVEDRFTSPLLGITFDCSDGLKVFHANGSPFLTFRELSEAASSAAAERDAAAAERDAAAAQRDAATARLARLEQQLKQLGAEPRSK